MLYNVLQRFQDGKGIHTEWVLVASNKTTKGLFKMLPSPHHPYIECYIENENQAKSGFLIKADKKVFFPVRCKVTNDAPSYFILLNYLN